MYYQTFWRSVNACVKGRQREKLNQFPIKPFYHHSLWYSLRCYSHLPFLISKTFSHILPMYRFNQLVTAKTISERLLLSFNFKYTKLPILNRKFLFLFISFKHFRIEFPCNINIIFHKIEIHSCLTMCARRRVKGLNAVYSK